jgi:Tfp pilus assembly protein PilF
MADRIDKIKAFLQGSPADCFLNHALALEYMKLGDEQNARERFEINLANDHTYVATYYHFGKLLERTGELDTARNIYKMGMTEARAAKDMHSYSELQNALEETED